MAELSCGVGFKYGIMFCYAMLVSRVQIWESPTLFESVAGKLLGIQYTADQGPSDSKSNWLHVDIFRL